MDSVNKTLYIPLYGKALVSKKGIILKDNKAEEIWQSQSFKLKGKSKSKWLAYFMSMRAKIFDDWLKNAIKQTQNAIVLHLGCGLDSRVLRVNAENQLWYDVDFESVIEKRKKYFTESKNYRMICADISNANFIEQLPKNLNAIVLMEGVSMYLQTEQLKNIFCALKKHFNSVFVLVDCYSEFGAKMSKIKNPIKEVGVNMVYGVKNANQLIDGTGLVFSEELSLTPDYLINELKGFEKFIFKNLYAGKISKKIYKLYEYKA